MISTFVCETVGYYIQQYCSIMLNGMSYRYSLCLQHTYLLCYYTGAAFSFTINHSKESLNHLTNSRHVVYVYSERPRGESNKMWSCSWPRCCRSGSAAASARKRQYDGWVQQKLRHIVTIFQEFKATRLCRICLSRAVHLDQRSQRRLRGSWYFNVRVDYEGRASRQRASPDPSDKCSDRHCTAVVHLSRRAALFRRLHLEKTNTTSYDILYLYTGL